MAPEFFTSVYSKWNHTTLERLSPFQTCPDKHFIVQSSLMIFQWDFHLAADVELHISIITLGKTREEKENSIHCLCQSYFRPQREELGELIVETFLNFVTNPFLPSSLQYQYVTLNYFIKYFIAYVTCLSLKTNFRSSWIWLQAFPSKVTC